MKLKVVLLYEVFRCQAGPGRLYSKSTHRNITSFAHNSYKDHLYMDHLFIYLTIQHACLNKFQL